MTLTIDKIQATAAAFDVDKLAAEIYVAMFSYESEDGYQEGDEKFRALAAFQYAEAFIALREQRRRKKAPAG